MTTTRTSVDGVPRATAGARRSRRRAPRLFSLEGGYIVLDEAAAARGPRALASVAAEWRDYHVTAITRTPPGASDAALAELGRAAQLFDRVVICQSCHVSTAGSAEAAAQFARAVRSAGRTECHVVADAHRALRHCIDVIAPGAVVAYCCSDIQSAVRILAEYGAVPVRKAERMPREGVAGVQVTKKDGTSGELAAAHG